MPALSTIIAVLHYKMKHQFWTGFYFVSTDKELHVGPGVFGLPGAFGQRGALFPLDDHRKGPPGIQEGLGLYNILGKIKDG